MFKNLFVYTAILITLCLALTACGAPSMGSEPPPTTKAAPEAALEAAPTKAVNVAPSPTASAPPELATVLPDLGPAPDFTNEVWINTDMPLTLDELRGKVVLVEFWTFG